MRERSTIQFIGLGGIASGSGFVYTYLHAHPATCIPTQATRFFSDPERFARGSEWYEAHFNACAAGKIRGEAAEEYLGDLAAVERIARTYPRAQLLAVVCDPIRRLYNEYEREKEAESIAATMTFSQYLEAYPESLERGLFGKQLKAYLDFYSPVQLLILVHEDRYDDPIKYVQTVYRFLEIDDTFVPKPLRPFVEIDPDNPPPRPWYIRLLRLVLFPIFLLRLDRLAFWVWNQIWPHIKYRLLPRRLTEPKRAPAGPKPLPIAAELRAALVEYYAADVRVLSGLLYRDLNIEWHIEDRR